MNNSEGLKPFQQSLAGLPQWVSERILQQINQLTRYEPVIGIMGKTGVGKSSLAIWGIIIEIRVNRRYRWKDEMVHK